MRKSLGRLDQNHWFLLHLHQEIQVFKPILIKLQENIHETERFLGIENFPETEVNFSETEIFPETPKNEIFSCFYSSKKSVKKAWLQASLKP